MKSIEVIIIGVSNEENELGLILLKDRTRETRRENYARDRNGNHGHNPEKMEIRAKNKACRRIMRTALASRCTHQENGQIFTKR